MGASKAQLEASKGCFSFYGQMVGVNRLTYAGPSLYPHYCDSTQLYNLRHDPSEQRNVYLDHPRTAERLTKGLRNSTKQLQMVEATSDSAVAKQQPYRYCCYGFTPTPGIPTQLTLTQL